VYYFQIKNTPTKTAVYYSDGRLYKIGFDTIVDELSPGIWFIRQGENLQNGSKFFKP